MKALLYNALKRAPPVCNVDVSVTTVYYAMFEEHFFDFCAQELNKINCFFKGKSKMRISAIFPKIIKKHAWKTIPFVIFSKSMIIIHSKCCLFPQRNCQKPQIL